MRAAGRLLSGGLAAGALLAALPGVAAAADESAPIDSGNTAWLLISTALVMVMLPGLALFYGGLVRRKNVLSTIMHSFFGLALVSVVWVLVGFSLAFGTDVSLPIIGAGFIGGFDYVGFMNVGEAPSAIYATTIPFVLMPHFVSPGQLRRVKRAVGCLSAVLDRFCDAYADDERLRDELAVPAAEDALIRLDPGFTQPLRICRLDAFLQGYEVKFLEFNADSPAGIGYTDVLHEGLARSISLPARSRSKWKYSSIWARTARASPDSGSRESARRSAVSTAGTTSSGGRK